MAKKNTVECTLTNDSAYITNASDANYEALREFWSFYPPGYRNAQSFKLWLDAYVREKAKAARQDREPDFSKLPGWDGRIRMFKRGKVTSGLFRATRAEIEETLGIKFVVTEDLPTDSYGKQGFRTDDPKYEYQNQCVDAMLKCFALGGGVVLSATATGKTRMAAQFFSNLSCSVLFVVDKKGLMYQSQAELSKWLGESVGVVGDSKFILGRVTVATVQTLKLHYDDPVFVTWFKSIKCVLIDELHTMMARKNFRLLEDIDPIARYGLTATLQMGKKEVRMKTWQYAGPVIFEFPYDEGRAAGVLSDGKVLQLRFENLDADDAYLGTDTMMEAEVYTNEYKLWMCRQVVKAMIKAGRYVVVIANRLTHVKAISGALHDVDHRIIRGSVSMKRRTRAKELFEEGAIRLLITSSVFEKGENVRRVDGMVDMAELPNKNNAVQKFGRGVRLHEEKDGLLYVDFATNDGALRKSALRRRNAFRKLDVEVKVQTVTDLRQAKIAFNKWLSEASRPVTTTKVTGTLPRGGKVGRNG